jgi:hypothetical protein
VRWPPNKPLKAGDLLKAGNTLTQRVFRTASNSATARIDFSGLADGQEAGLCHFGKSWATLGVVQTGDRRILAVAIHGKSTPGPDVTAAILWLRTTWDFDGISHFSFSTDGKTFTAIGAPFKLAWGYYRGDRLGLYTFNNKQDRGYVDVDSLDCTYDIPPGVSRESAPPLP